jgi:molybdopterin molybdotransferase
MLSFDDARSLVVRDVTPVAVERISVFESHGRVLREDVVATAPMPAFDYSAMDGYAYRTADLSGDGPHALRVVGVSSAGAPLAQLTPGTACRIFTGAVLPGGADAVIMQEDVTLDGDVARFASVGRAFANVRRRGEDLGAGQIALRAGELLHPGRLALAASLDRATLAVSRRPVVGVLGTGDELRSPGEPGPLGTIVESNGFFVKAAAERVGALARLHRFVADDEAALDAAFGEALAGTDLLVTIGGVSVGDRDLVRPALARAGVEITFHKVAMKPGKPLTFGRRGNTIVLGLPGNPASSSLTFLLFGLPILRRLLGMSEVFEATERLPLRVAGGRVARKPGRTELARGVFRDEAGARVVELAANQASGAVTSFAEAECLVRLEAEVAELSDGDRVSVIPLWR